MSSEERTNQALAAAVAQLGGSERPGQQEMARAVTRSLSERHHLLVQAGTGTGKSLGYLVPLVLHALSTDRPVLVATATLALQSQIMRRDLPRLLQALESAGYERPNVALLKGRSNYLCLNKVHGGYASQDENALFDVSEPAAPPSSGPRIMGTKVYSSQSSRLGEEVKRLRSWAEETETGDRDELRPGVSHGAWKQVSVSAQECIGAQKCSFAEECFSERARERAATADLIVTNHALLAIAAFEGLAVLPEYQAVVIDEAHEFQERVRTAVTEFLSKSMVLAAASMARSAAKIDDEPLLAAAEALDVELSRREEGLLASGMNQPLSASVAMVRDAARAALSDLKPDQGETDPSVHGAKTKVQELLGVCERLLGQTEEEEVLWIARPQEFTPGSGYSRSEDAATFLYIAPISVAMKLRSGLFEDHTVVMTSATLALGGEFSYVAADVGLGGDQAPKYAQLDVGSPFDYPKQGILYTPRHLPRPGLHASEEAKTEMLRLIKASGGACLGLFSSLRAAEEAAEWVRQRLDGIEVLCQGEGTMASLIEDFAQNESTCLFGTMTLWQGVDVPGRHNRLVLIDRIPFPRPDDPISTARSRVIARHGGNGFMRVAASSAAIKLAQGVGRLIRSTQDRGVVAILDSRLRTERYGSFLLKSLPELWVCEDLSIVEAALERLEAQPS